MKGGGELRTGLVRDIFGFSNNNQSRTGTLR